MLADYSSLALATSGIIHYWPLSESSGTTAADQVSSGTDNATWGSNFPTTNAVTGPDGTAVAAKNDGTSGRVGITGSTFTMPASHTICYWIRLDSQTGADNMSFEWAPSGFAQFVQHDIGYTGSTGGASNTSVVISAYYGTVSGACGAWFLRSLLTTGVWHFLAVTHTTGNANGMTIYLDGINVTQTSGLATVAQTASPSAANLGIMGRWPTNNLALNGAMQGVAIFNRVLTTTEINSLQSAMTGGGSNPVSGNPPVAASMSSLVTVTANSGSPDGLNYNAFPGLTAAPDGSLILTYHHANDHTGSSSCQLVAQRSTDQGATWAPIAGSPLRSASGVNIADMSCFTMADGEVGILWNESTTPGAANINTVVTYYMAFSSNNGVSFGAPVVITPGFATNGAGQAGAYGIAPCPPIQLANGNLLLPVYGFDDKTNTGSFGLEYVICAQSTDNGRTWSNLSTIFPKAAGFNYDETALLLLDNGNVLVACRTNENGNPTIWTAVSTDSGATWGSKTRALGTGASTTGWGGRPSLVQTSTGLVLLRTRFMYQAASSWTGFRKSSDRGATWSSGIDPFDGNLERTTNVLSSGSPGRGQDVYGAFALLNKNKTVAYVWAEDTGASTFFYTRNLSFTDLTTTTTAGALSTPILSSFRLSMMGIG